MEENENTQEAEISVKDKIVTEYLKFIEENSRLPNVSDFQAVDITRHAIRHHFGNITKLHDYIVEHHWEILDSCVANENTIFTKARKKELDETIRNSSQFVITTAVSGKAVFDPFHETLKKYCESTGAVLLVLPVSDIGTTRRKTNQWNFSPSLKEEHFIFDDTKLNDNLFLNSIKLSAKHINPLTGLSRIGQRNGTFIYASPKQFLEFVATSNNTEKMPHAIMTTGAITVPDYNTDRYLSERTSYIAENDHVIGAIIVDVHDDKYFDFRQIQSDADGAFCDMGYRYSTDGETLFVDKAKNHLVLGDWHSGSTDPFVKDAAKELCEIIEPETLYLHDFFDGRSISHHEIHIPGKQALKGMNDMLSLEKELDCGANDLVDIVWNWNVGEVKLVKSNHDEVLQRWLMEGSYVTDPVNHYPALEYARVMLEGKDPIEYAYRKRLPEDVNDIVTFMTRETSDQIAGIEMAAHGDLGSNGARGSLQSLEKAYGQCVIGHAHSAAILRGVYRVGTSTTLRLDYMKGGPSSWTQTACIVYESGHRQLINFINKDTKG